MSSPQSVACSAFTSSLRGLTFIIHGDHGDPISNFTVLVTNLAQGPSLGEGDRWSQIRLQQSLLEFNGVVIVILFDFLIEVQ